MKFRSAMGHRENDFFSSEEILYFDMNIFFHFFPILQK